MDRAPHQVHAALPDERLHVTEKMPAMSSRGGGSVITWRCASPAFEVLNTLRACLPPARVSGSSVRGRGMQTGLGSGCAGEIDCGPMWPLPRSLVRRPEAVHHPVVSGRIRPPVFGRFFEDEHAGSASRAKIAKIILLAPHGVGTAAIFRRWRSRPGESGDKAESTVQGETRNLRLWREARLCLPSANRISLVRRCRTNTWCTRENLSPMASMSAATAA
jgi:hypothetical protein